MVDTVSILYLEIMTDCLAYISDFLVHHFHESFE
jgi:hypothetical protein